MKLFLCSKDFPESSQKAVAQLVGKPINKISVNYVNNAKDLKPAPPTDYRGTKEEVANVVGKLEQLDLRDFDGRQEDFKKKAKSADILWFGGGNTYYLRYILKKTKLDKAVIELVKDGLIYAGTSAGAIVAGPTLKHFERMDDPSSPPEMVEEGLGLVDFVTIPHWGDESYGGKPREVQNDLLAKTGFSTMPLRDSEAVVVDGGKITKVK